MTDPDIVARAAAGSRSAANELFARYTRPLYLYIHGRVGRRDADAEAVLQETMSAAVRSLPSYRAESGFWAWLTGIARRKVADHFEQTKRREDRVSIVDLDEDTCGAVAADLDRRDLTSAETDACDVDALVETTLAEVTESARTLLLAKYRSGLSVREIAARTSATEKSVEAGLYRARLEFRDVFRRLAARNRTARAERSP